MTEFAGYCERGKDHTGKRTDSVLKSFNDDIRSQRKAFVRGGKGRGFRNAPSTPDDFVKRGRSYLKCKDVFKGVVGSMMAGWAQDAVASQANALNTIANSQHFRRGVEKLSQGDLLGCETEFFGGGGDPYGGLFGEINAQVDFKAAANFERAYRIAKEKAERQARMAGISE